MIWIAPAIGLVAAVLALIAARVTIRNSQDDFISDLHTQGRWMARAALANVIASLALIIGIAVQVVEQAG